MQIAAKEHAEKMKSTKPKPPKRSDTRRDVTFIDAQSGLIKMPAPELPVRDGSRSRRMDVQREPSEQKDEISFGSVSEEQEAE
jgi:hypothetical protein